MTQICSQHPHCKSWVSELSFSQTIEFLDEDLDLEDEVDWVLVAFAEEYCGGWIYSYLLKSPMALFGEEQIGYTWDW